MSEKRQNLEDSARNRSPKPRSVFSGFVRKVLMKGYRLICRMSCSRCRRPSVVWQEPMRMSLDEMYAFYDESSADVIARHARRRPCPPSMLGRSLTYSFDRTAFGFRFAGNGNPKSWIYLSSRRTLPTVYALEFEYIPHSVFREFLQIVFCGDDLDNRHRFVFRDNESVEYEMFRHGLFAKPIRRVPFRLELHRASTIRLEVVGNVFTVLVNGSEIVTVRDRLWQRRPTVGKLIFWNDCDPVKMDFELGEVRLSSSGEVS